MVSGVFSAARELPRLREISSVLIRHGLGDLVRRTGVSTLLERRSPGGASSRVASTPPRSRVTRSQLMATMRAPRISSPTR